jgi:outer membrane biosynthesis protein TonB
MLAALDAEMAAELGVIRSEYADKKTFRKAAAAAGLSWPMVQAEGTRRSGKPSAVEARNERLRLQAITEEEQGLPMHVAAPGEKLTYTQRALNRFREEVRASSEVTKPSSPEIPKLKALKAAEVPKAAPKAEPKAEPKAAPKAEAKPEVKAEPKAEPKAAPKAEAKAEVKPKAELTPKQAAMLAALEAEYQEIKLGGIVYLRHKTLDTIYTKGEKAWELGEEMPEWDEDLGEWKTE